MQTKYVANDGSEFFDAVLCRAYEILIEAPDAEKFNAVVRNLFQDCTSYADDGYGERTAKVFYFTQMPKFKANLIRALPELQRELQAAFDEVKQRS